MGASCCSSQVVAKDPCAEAPQSLPPLSRHESSSRRKRQPPSLTNESSVPPAELPVVSPVTARVPTLIRVPPTTSARLPTLDPALDLLTDTFAVSATTLSDAGDVGEDVSSWVDVSMLTHTIHPHRRSVSDVISENDLASWDPKVDRLGVVHRRERERFMRVETDNRLRLEQRVGASRCKMLVRAYKEEFMLQRRTLLREFFLQRLSLFADACVMQAEVGGASLIQEEDAAWQALHSAAPVLLPPMLDGEATSPPDRFARTNKTVESLEDGPQPSQSLTTTLENDPLSSSFGECTTASGIRTSGTGSSASSHYVDPRSIVYSKTVARIEQAKQPDGEAPLLDQAALS